MLLKSHTMPAATNLCSTQSSTDVEVFEYVLQTVKSSMQQLEIVVAVREHQPSWTAGCCGVNCAGCGWRWNYFHARWCWAWLNSAWHHNSIITYIIICLQWAIVLVDVNNINCKINCRRSPLFWALCWHCWWNLWMNSRCWILWVSYRSDPNRRSTAWDASDLINSSRDCARQCETAECTCCCRVRCRLRHM